MTDTTPAARRAPDQEATREPFHRLLRTGAAANLSRQLRGAFAAWAEVVRVSDIAPLGEVAAQKQGVKRIV